MNMKVNCLDCKKEINPYTEISYLIGHYRGQRHGTMKKVCQNCYQPRELEYLQNYETIFKHDYQDGLFQHIIKQRWADCYANQKDQNGKILKQGNCRHYSPWEPDKCINCGKTIEKIETIHLGKNGETLCSNECVDIYNKKDIPKLAKTCSECGKTISDLQITTCEGKDYCSPECLAKGTTPENNPQQNPPKSPNNDQNKGMSAGLKIFFWITGISLVLVMAAVGIKTFSKKKKKKNLTDKNSTTFSL